MTSSNHSTTSITTLMFMRSGIPIYDSLTMVDNWLKANPKQSHETLAQLFDSGQIIVKNNRLQEVKELSLEEAIDWAKKIQQDRQLVIQDRWYHLKCYKQCFVGSELAEYLQEHHNLTIEEAISIGTSLWKHHLIAHVCSEHEYINGFLFYRFVK